MDQFINNRNNEIFAKLLADPTDAGQYYKSNLQNLVESFPQSGIIRAMMAHVNRENAVNLRSAAARYDSRLLYRLINAPETLAEVDASQVIFQSDNRNDRVFHINNDAAATEVITEDVAAPEAETAPDSVTEAQVPEINFSQAVQPAGDVGETEATATEHVAEAQKTEAPVTEHTQPIVEEAAAPASHEIEDEVYDEISGIESFRLDVEKPLAENHIEAVKAEEEKLIAENLAATDFFVFEQAYETGSAVTDDEIKPVIQQQVPVTQPEADTQDVSKYFDEKLPYTFMWWLDKTRREHADIYQPFASNQQPVKAAGDQRLQQLYYENIFQITPADGIGKATEGGNIEFDMTNKTDRIIGRFIQEDPHINPPAGDRLDNENKAKQSSEDNDVVVSETLARIYADQMLYHKAIASYKKLMLKFPEKSRYFADHIEQLEKKIN